MRQGFLLSSQGAACALNRERRGRLGLGLNGDSRGGQERSGRPGQADTVQPPIPPPAGTHPARHPGRIQTPPFTVDLIQSGKRIKHYTE